MTELAQLKIAADTMWVLVTAMLVFFMNLGFAFVESGFCRSKNAVNILSKNFIVFAVSSIAFWGIGWGLMFGDGSIWVGMKGLMGLSGADNSPLTGTAYQGVYQSIGWAGVPLFAKFFFQLVFAGTAATIVSGAVAERIKYISFIVFSFLLVGFIYPIVGHWMWGGGYFSKIGAWDFAGSTVVHSVGGWAALMGAIILGPRFGKYRKDGSVNAIPGHNLGMATLGALVLWFGWFGFNPGSTMAAVPADIARIAVTTTMAAAAGLLSATAVSWLVMKKPDLGMTINGCLAGLVGVTAPCAFISVGSSLMIGTISGILVVFAVMFFDRLHIDDPVGAISVHLINGVFGTLAIGLFTDPKFMGDAGPKAGLFLGGGWGQLGAQFIAVALTAFFVVIAASLAWLAIKATLGLRVSPEEELKGLDIGEHGNQAYPEFVVRNMISA